MHYSTSTTRKLGEKYKEISLLGNVQALLGWDLNVNLPPKASNSRAQQSAYITSLTADRWLNPEFRTLFEKASSETKKLSPLEKAMLRNIGWSGKYYWKVPKELVVEFSETTSEAFMAWHKAKTEDKFSLFSDYLQKNIRLSQRIADHLGYKKNRYDALLDLYEMGLTTDVCSNIFKTLIKELRPFMKQIIKKQSNNETMKQLINENTFYSEKRQRQLSLFILRKLGYDLSAGRLDVSPHPFTQSMTKHDARITTKYLLHDFRSSFTATIHEAGHGLYEQGVADEFEGTALDSGVSLGIHESQSRFWENQIGRSPEFLTFMAPVFQAFFPEHLSQSTTDHIVSLFNNVEPGFIRIEADEVTYNFHIALRFELEEKLINEKLKVKDLPEIWREKMDEYLEVRPKTDSEGVLQDVHWSYGNFGYFPTYTLGNLNAAQFTHAMKKELKIEELVARGEFGTILSWLRDNIHKHGASIWPDELVKKVTGEELNPKYFVEYIKEKYSALI